VDQADDQPSWFVLVYDTATMQILSLTGFGHDYVGAVLAFTAGIDQHRHRPGVAVHLHEADSLAELLERHAGLFARLRFPDDD
jgi:hypothetical protein